MLREHIGSAPDSPDIASVDGRVSFGPFVLDREERTLQRHGTEIALPERSLRLLEVLVRLAGKTVSKDRLVAEVWQGAFVSDTSLTEAMSRLRHALGTEAREPGYIRTVHGRGYCFVVPVGATGDRYGGGAAGRPAWIPVSIAASLTLLGVLGLGSVLAGGGHRSALDSVGFSTDSPGMAWTPLRGLGGWLLGVAAPGARPVGPRYRLAEVTLEGARIFKYGVPALPLSGFSVDRTGSRVAFSIANGQHSDAWVVEPEKGELRRFTTGGRFLDPVWTPSGQAVALAQSRNGSFDLVLKEVDGDTPVQVLLEARLDQFPESWSSDGRSLVYSERHPETGYDLWLLRQRSDDSWVPTPLVRTPDDEAFGAISPDGRYVAFTSMAGRRKDVFVVDLERDRAPFRVSTDGGSYPFWSAAGDLLHYVHGDELLSIPTDQIDGDVIGASRISTPVAGLYLAGSTSAADRIVVAMLE